MQKTSEEQHNREIHANKRIWENKPALRDVYYNFHKRIKEQLRFDIPGIILELGSGMGNIKKTIPRVTTSDIFDNPWIDRRESAYKSNLEENAVSNLILIDVWHHLEYPAAALKEFYRILAQGGRIIIFEPDMSLLGLVVYGIFHHEPINLLKTINTKTPSSEELLNSSYYAAQSNAFKVFRLKRYRKILEGWKVIKTISYADLDYVISGGYQEFQLLPDKAFGSLRKVNRILDYLPWIFSSRIMIVLEK